MDPRGRPPTGRFPRSPRSKYTRVGTEKIGDQGHHQRPWQEGKNGDLLTVNYVGALYSNSKVFDSSWLRDEPFIFTFGRGEVIEGWEEALGVCVLGDDEN
jgi:FKBP-type peptidyl-prolyl cis-trans isomerase